MEYRIQEISNMFHIPISTIRYYDKQGLIPNLERDHAGNRIFHENHIETLRVIECLKRIDMPIKDIKEFMHWVAMGDETITKRKDMFFLQKKIVEKKIMELQETLNMIDFKCWYYTVAEEDQTEEKVKQMLPQDMPQEIRQKYFNSHQKKESK